jgi:cytochrome c oxidase subunit 2
VNIPSSITTLIAGIALTLISLWYGQNHGLLPMAASEEAAQVDALFNMMMTVATGLFLIVQGVVLYSAFRFRRQKGDNTDGPPVHGNIPLEIVWTAIPAVILFIVSIYSFEIYNAMGGLDPMASHDDHGRQGIEQVGKPSEGSPEKNLLALDPNQAIALGLGASPEKRGQPVPLTIDVTALQYAWLFNYTDSGITTGEMHLPVGQEVQLNISAQDVIHAFWLPEFRLKQDAVPGRLAQMRFTPTKEGQYPIICAELCGPYHGAMNAQLYVQSPEEYQNWVSEQQVASTNGMEKAIATNPADLSEGEFLAPYVKDLGIDAHTLEQLHATHHHPNQ